MLPSAEFICLRVAYREAFWEELSRLIWRKRSIRRPLLFWVHVIYFHSLPRELVAVLKVSCFAFLNCSEWLLLDIIFLPQLSSRAAYSLLLHLDPREKISSPIQDLFCPRKPSTFPGSASVHCGLHERTEYPLSQALTFFAQTSVSCWTLLLSRK